MWVVFMTWLFPFVCKLASFFCSLLLLLLFSVLLLLLMFGLVVLLGEIGSGMLVLHFVHIYASQNERKRREKGKEKREE